MPFPNVDPDKQDEMEICVQEVMGDGMDKESAIAICHTSIMGKDAERKPKRRKERGSRRRAEMRAALLEAADLLPDEPEAQAEPEPEVKEAPAAQAPVTFEALDAARAGEQHAQQVAQLAADYRALADNAIATKADPGAHLIRLAHAFRQRMTTLAASVKARIAPDRTPALPDLCAKAREAGGAFVVRKAADGGYRWLGVYSNNFQDRDGEIITKDAHEEFMAYLDANPSQAPEWWTWHEDIGRKSRADTWAIADGFTFISGPATERDAAPYVGLGEPRGMSHQFTREKQGKTITKYRTFEVSDLPPEAAANPWTDFVVQEATMAFPDAKRKDFVRLFGEEMTAQLEARAAEQAKALTDAGIQSKEAPADTQQTVTAQTPAAPAPQTTDAQVPAQDAAPAQGEQHPQEPATEGVLAEMVELVKSMKAQADAHALEIEALKADRKAAIDAAVAEALTPRVTPAQAGVKASTSPQTVSEAAGEIVQKERGNEWLRAIGPVVPQK